MPSNCRYIGCKNCSDINKISFIRFPLNVQRCNQWIEACGRPELHLKGNLYNTNRICEKHFLPEDFNYYEEEGRKLRKRLKRGAIPIHYKTLQENQTSEESTSSSRGIKNDSELTIQEPVFIDVNNIDGKTPSHPLITITPITNPTSFQNLQQLIKIQNPIGPAPTQIVALQQNPTQPTINPKDIIYVKVPVEKAQAQPQEKHKEEPIRSWNTYENFLKMCDDHLPPNFARIAKIQALFYKRKKE